MQRMKDTTSITQGSDDKLTKHNLFETSRFFADVYVLRPGQSQAAHTHESEDKCYYVIEGEGIVISGGERHVAGPGRIVMCPAGDEHGVENTSDADLRLLVFMAPHPRRKRLV